MLSLILCFLYTISAQPLFDTLIYSRIYLRGLKKLENERIQAHLIDEGITYLENGIFKAAKQGLVKYTTEPFPGCEHYNRPSELAPNGIDKELCENIVNGIRRLVSVRFPDSEIVYDANTVRYTLNWD